MKKIYYYYADIPDYQQFYEIKGNGQYFNRFSKYDTLIGFLLKDLEDGMFDSFKIYFETAILNNDGEEIEYKKKLIYSYDKNQIKKFDKKTNGEFKNIF